MKIQIKSNSLVILANAHNASILTDSFLLNSGIIVNLEELNREQLIITSQYSQVVLNDETNIVVDSNRFAVTAKNSQRPYIIGQKYCNSLKYINAQAIGINFDIEVSDFNFEDWFNSLLKFPNSKCSEVKYKIENCNITFKYSSTQTALINFNFHYDIEQSELLGDIKIDFTKEWELNNSKVNTILQTLK